MNEYDQRRSPGPPTGAGAAGPPTGAGAAGPPTGVTSEGPRAGAAAPADPPTAAPASPPPTTSSVPRAPGRRPARRRLARILLVACVLALAVVASTAALFRSAPDARWYYAANLGALLRLQPFPGAKQVALTSFRHADQRSDAPVFKVTWYTTRAAYVVPRGSSPADIVSFFRFQLEPFWTSRDLSQDVVRGETTVARMPGLQASQGDMFVTVLTSSMVGADGKQRAHPRYTVQVDYRVQ